MSSIHMVQRRMVSLPSLSALLQRVGRFVDSLFALVALMFQRARQRRALARLDPRLLRDIGISPEQARQEIDKPFWRQ
ncbi:DUF1127 domain-containing protein [Thiosocius teredinicola]|uniref:DUF1127 domain-containing protein n=1 Tax=Thiosocius teredinicola TaxID=1973002 RepID=UPI002FE49F4F